MFVRVSGCNLRCAWCDTPYASWRPEGPILDIDTILAKVSDYRCKHIVLTGGEPMLFPEAASLTRPWREQGRTITIETAGTVFQEVECDLLSISPKLRNSRPDDPTWSARHERTRQNIEPLKRLIERYPCQLKFVVNPEEGDDFDEISRLLDELPPVSSDRILLMAEGTTTEILERRMRLLVEPCLQNGWRLSPRLHVHLFGNVRGT